MMLTVRQSTLPSLWCEKPETSVVPISEKCTAAEAAAGAMPVASSSVEDVTPYAMPREPSTSWAEARHDGKEDQVSHGVRTLRTWFGAQAAYASCRPAILVEYSTRVKM